MALDIYHKPSFNWWVNAVLKKSLRITFLCQEANAHCLNKTHKFGIEVHKYAAQAYSLDENNGNTLW